MRVQRRVTSTGWGGAPLQAAACGRELGSVLSGSPCCALAGARTFLPCSVYMAPARAGTERGHQYNRLRVFRIANTVHLGCGVGQER